MLRTWTWVVLIAVACNAQASRVHAGEGCCAKCGCSDGATKVCRRVEETKKITVTCWGLEEEDFCLPGPSHAECTHCEEACEEACQAGCCHGRQHYFVWHDWSPSRRAKVFTRRKLMKRTVTRTVPSYKWVVEDVCPKCGGGK